MTSTGITIGATAVAPTLCVPGLAPEAPPDPPESGCACVQRPSQRLVVPPPDDEAVNDRQYRAPRTRG